MSKVPVVNYLYHISDVPVVDLSPGDRVLNLLSCLPWTGARARLVPRCPDVLSSLPADLLDWPVVNARCVLKVHPNSHPGREASSVCTVPPWLAQVTARSKLPQTPRLSR